MGRADSSLRSSSTVQPRCYCSRADRDGDGGEAERGGGEEEGRMEHRESDMYMHVLYIREEKWAFPSEFRPFLRTSTGARVYLISNRLPIFSRSIPPRGNLKGHCGSAWIITFYHPNNIFIERLAGPDVISLNAIDIVPAEILVSKLCKLKYVIIGVEVSLGSFREKRRVKRGWYTCTANNFQSAHRLLNRPTRSTLSTLPRRAPL